MTLHEEEPLFEVRPVARLERGDRVRIQAVWGAEISAEVVKVGTDATFPVVTLKTRMGDTITINVARIRPEDKICVECGNDLVCEGYELCSECLEQTT